MTTNEEILKPRVYSVTRYKEFEKLRSERLEYESLVSRTNWRNEEKIKELLSIWDKEHPPIEPDCFSQEQMEKQKKLAREDVLCNCLVSSGKSPVHSNECNFAQAIIVEEKEKEIQTLKNDLLAQELLAKAHLEAREKAEAELEIYKKNSNPQTIRFISKALANEEKITRLENDKVLLKKQIDKQDEDFRFVVKEKTRLENALSSLVNRRAIGYLLRIRDGKWLDLGDRAYAWTWLEMLLQAEGERTDQNKKALEGEKK